MLVLANGAAKIRMTTPISGVVRTVQARNAIKAVIRIFVGDTKHDRTPNKSPIKKDMLADESFDFSEAILKFSSLRPQKSKIILLISTLERTSHETDLEEKKSGREHKHTRIPEINVGKEMSIIVMYCFIGYKTETTAPMIKRIIA